MIFELWWMLACMVGTVVWIAMESYAAGKRAGWAEARQEHREVVFSALRGAVDDAATNGERSAAWRVARHALEPES